MSQGDCERVQIAQLGIQKAARRGSLPTDPKQMVDVLRQPGGPLPVALDKEERLLVASHLETCAACVAFWEEQLKLGTLLGEAAFHLPPEATPLESTRLADRLFGLTLSGESQKQPATTNLQDYLAKKREVRVPTKFQKQLALVAAGVSLVVLGVIYFSYLYQPVRQEDVQGAIGKRDVYRETNMTEKDVTANSGPGGPSVAGLLEFMKSPEFKALANSSNYQSLVNNNGLAFTQLVNNNSFQQMANQVQNNQANALVQSVGLVVTSGLSQNNAFQQLLNSNQFQQAVANSSNFQQLQQNTALAANSNFQQLIHNNQFNQVMANAGFYSFVHENAGSLPDLSSMVNNSAFQQLVNSNSLQGLLNNNAFNSLVSNQAFQVLSLVSGLQNNSNFAALANNGNFIALVNNSNFHGLINNQAFQQLLQDSNFHQVVASQEQGTALANNNQFSQLIHQNQYQNLANNNQFQNLINNANFANVVANQAFQNLISQNQFQLFLFNQQLASFASSAAALNSIMQQSQELGIVIPQ